MSEQRSPARIPEWTLGWRLRRALDDADVSVQEMAQYLELSRSQISRYLNDHGAPPKKLLVKEWAMRCGVDRDWLAGDGTRTSSGPDDGPGADGVVYPPWDSNPEPAAFDTDRLVLVGAAA